MDQEHHVSPPKFVPKTAINFETTKIHKSECDTLMIRYLAISDRFPHLSLREIVSFERLVKAAGGSVMVHSGIFGGCERWSKLDNGAHLIYMMAWTCCHSVYKREYSGEYGYSYSQPCVSKIHGENLNLAGIHSAKACNLGQMQKYGNKNAPNLCDPNPIGECDSPIMFTL